MSDPLDFVKNLWGSMSVPGMGPLSSMAPAMSVEDLDKKIADLKAVESWLNVNMSMLRGTIQTLEVQRGTMVTLKSMSAAMAAAVKQPDAGGNPAAAPYAAFFGQAAADTWASAAKAPAKAEPKAEAPKDPLPAAAAAAAAITNPTAWWNMLQDQFTAAVSTAMAPDAMAKAQEAAQPVQKEAEQAGEKAEAKRAAARKTAKPKDEGSAG